MADDAITTVDQTLTPSLSTSDDNPAAPASANGGEIDEEDPDSCRDSKRRKMCPKALDQIQEFVPPCRTFSFTFDTKNSACGPDVTPKFGSFNSVEESKLSTAKDQPCEIQPEILESKEEGGEEETEALGVFEVIEGVELNDGDFPPEIGENVEL